MGHQIGRSPSQYSVHIADNAHFFWLAKDVVDLCLNRNVLLQTAGRLHNLICLRQGDHCAQHVDDHRGDVQHSSDAHAPTAELRCHDARAGLRCAQNQLRSIKGEIVI